MPQKKKPLKPTRHRASGARTSAPTNTPTPPAETDRDRIEWLLGFLRTPLPHLRPGQILDLQEDAWRFLQFYRVVEPGAEQQQESLTTHMMRRSVLLRMQGDLNTGMECLEESGGGQWNVFPKTPVDTIYHADGKSEVLERRDPPDWIYVRRPDGTIERRFSGNEPTVLISAAAELLCRWRKELRRCRHCDALFLPSHGRKVYHDLACAAQARSTKAAAGKRPRDYHEEYKKRLKKQQGPKFKPPQRRGPRRRT